MSRGYNAKRKARRQQVRATAEPRPAAGGPWRQRLLVLVPVSLVAGIFALVGVLGFGAGEGVSKKQVEQEVAALLAGIPQHGSSLGSPRAPLTVQVFADLECPTVRRFVVSYLPSIIDAWVRTGVASLEYRSLETDTLNEQTFFRQEVAALAAGGQDRMWNFVLTFVRQQESEYSGYATDDFLAGIAAQVPGLDRSRWRRDQEDPRLSERVALGVQAAHANDFRSTPSLLIWHTTGAAGKPALAGDRAARVREAEASLAADVNSLSEESSLDDPALHRQELEQRKEVRELGEK